ncbi:TPA: plasmid mobilization protein [Pseudomonas aeruginosa]
MKSGKPKQPEKSEKKPREKSVVISFRLSESAYEPYREPVEKSGLSRSEFFRNMFADNTHKVVISEKRVPTEDYNRYLHFVSKISNNINQLARLLNGAEKAGMVTAKQYLTGLNNLNSIRLLLQSKLGKKD